jgi:hypothetical protein
VTKKALQSAEIFYLDKGGIQMKFMSMLLRKHNPEKEARASGS